MKYLWDRVVVINRDDRQDRLSAFMSCLMNSKLLGDVRRFDAVTAKTLAHPTWFVSHIGSVARQAAYWCCRESHLRVWNQAILEGVRHLLVFEDDAVIPETFDQQAEAFFSELPEDWYGYQLGGFKWDGARKLTENCGLMKGCGGLHAYGLSAIGLQRTYDHVLYHNRSDLDHATAGLQGEEPHYYCPRKWFVPQVAGYSDNYFGWSGACGTDQLW
jgi:GR25 family glycosyltransferase involved in LPS biosynthesis